MSKKHSKLFNHIAPVYAMFYNFQVKYYRKTLSKMKDVIDLIEYETVLDIIIQKLIQFNYPFKYSA